FFGNLLFGLGFSFCVGGVTVRRAQQFNVQAVRMTTAMLTLASFGLIIPAATQYSHAAAQSISRETAVVLFVVYLAYLVAVLVSQKQVIGKEGVKASLKEKGERPDEVQEEPQVGWSRNKALVVLSA